MPTNRLIQGQALGFLEEDAVEASFLGPLFRGIWASSSAVIGAPLG